MTEKQALRDLKKRVREFMRDAEKMALERVDKLQAAGVDIAGDHARAAGPYSIPRDFIAAFADEMKHQFGMIRRDTPRAHKQRVKNYYLHM